MHKQIAKWVAGLILPFSITSFAADAVDMVFVVDESGSMSGEHSWIATMVNDLENQLIANGVGASPNSNRYALVGFGEETNIGGHTHPVGSGTWGTASELSTATSSLQITGDIEDGWDGINTAIGLSLRPGVARNIILVTDEDRDVFNNNLTFGGLLGDLFNDGFLLNSVVDHGFEDGDQFEAFGIDSEGNAYVDDGFGSYFQTLGGTPTTGEGTTEADYVDLALATGGAAWDLNLLRLGGSSAEAFTEAFIDIKVQEISQQEAPPETVPAPSVPYLMLMGLFGWWHLRRKNSI